WPVPGSDSGRDRAAGTHLEPGLPLPADRPAPGRTGQRWSSSSARPARRRRPARRAGPAASVQRPDPQDGTRARQQNHKETEKLPPAAAKIHGSFLPAEFDSWPSLLSHLVTLSSFPAGKLTRNVLPSPGMLSTLMAPPSKAT